jgi:hypothetical protein
VQQHDETVRYGCESAPNYTGKKKGATTQFHFVALLGLLAHFVITFYESQSLEIVRAAIRVEMGSVPKCVVHWVDKQDPWHEPVLAAHPLVRRSLRAAR